MSSSQTISLALTKVEHAGTDSKVEHAGTDSKVEHAGTDSKIEHGGTDARPKAGWASALLLGLVLILPSALFAGELEGFFPFNDGVWKVRGALNGPLTMQYVGKDVVNVSFATYDELGMPVMLVGSGSWNDGLIELPLYQVKAVHGFDDFAPTSNLMPWGHAAFVSSGCGAMDGQIWRLALKGENGGTSDKQENGGTSDKQENGGTSGDQENGGTSGDQENGGTSGDQENGGTSGDQENGGTSGNLVSIGVVEMYSRAAAAC